MKRQRARPVVTALLGVLLMLPAAYPVAAAGDEESQRLQEIQQQLERERTVSDTLGREAERLESEIANIRQESVVAARSAQSLESEITALEVRLAVLGAEEARKTAALEARRRQLGLTLGALERLALQPPQALLAAPGAPLDTARSAMLLGVAVPEIEQRAKTVREELAQLSGLRAEIAEQRKTMDQRVAALADEKARLDELAERKRALEQKTRARQQQAEKRLAALASEASDLRDLIARLEAEAERQRQEAARRERERLAREAEERQARERQAREQQARQQQARQQQAREQQQKAAAEAEAARARQNAQPATTQQASLPRPAEMRAFPDKPGGDLLLPAKGPITVRYGERFERGFSDISKGVVIETRAGAQVVAPFDGRVAYAGPFRAYGLILIIEHGGRYHTLLAGMERIGAAVGQWVLAGEPVGEMSRAGESRPELYLELRRSGQPINPLPWLATNNDKARG